MNTLKSLIALFFAAMLFASLFSKLSFAEKEFPLLFGELDTDADTYISIDEAGVRKDLKKNFKEIDSDNDGKLSLTEYQAYEGKGRYEPPEETETPELGAAPTE